MLFVFFILGDPPASEFYVLTFRNNLSVPSTHVVWTSRITGMGFAVRSHLFFLFTPPMKVEQTGCSETSAHKIQAPGNHPKEGIQHTHQEEVSKPRN